MTEGALRRSCKGPAVLSKSVSTPLRVPTKTTVSKSGKTVEDFLRVTRVTRHAVCQLISTVRRVQAGQGSSISQHLRATKNISQGVVSIRSMFGASEYLASED